MKQLKTRSGSGGARLALIVALMAVSFPLRTGASGGHLIIEPEAGSAPYVAAIRAAHHEVDVNSYLISDTQVEAALEADARRGVRVEVMVAGNPYLDTGDVAKEKKAFSGTGVAFRLAPPQFESDYHYDHAKYVLIDPGRPGASAILGASNLTKSGLGGEDRDYDWETKADKVVGALTRIFRADWNNRPSPTRTAPLVVSPGSEPALLRLIRGSRRSLDIESEEFGDVPTLDQALASAVRRGVAVEIVVPKDLSTSDKENLAPLKADGARVRTLGYPYVHAKLILADRSAFVGSENFSQSSLDDNREVGLVLGGSVAKALRTVFRADFAKASPLR